MLENAVNAHLKNRFLGSSFFENFTRRSLIYHFVYRDVIARDNKYFFNAQWGQLTFTAVIILSRALV